jgi:lysophospholipase L1-like esterase
VIPPTYQSGSDTIAAVGRELGIPVLVPVPDGVLDQSFYQTDGFHLNEKGAQSFTLQLATELKHELTKMSPD